MSIVNHNHPAGSELRGAGLWQTPQSTSEGHHDATVGSSTPLRLAPKKDSPVFSSPHGEDPWQSRIDSLVSSGLSGDAARHARRNATQAQSRAAFDAFRTQCRDELRPVLDTSTAMLQEWGLDAQVTETLHDQPSRLPRSFDLALRIDRFGERGPGKLTLSASEAHDAVRVKITVGPSRLCGEVREHIGTAQASDLSDTMMGGLVATLVERIFSA